MNLGRISPKLIIGILLGIFFFASFSLRVFLPYDQVFGSDWIRFTSVDCYFHMRMVDNIVYNFPTITNFDPYFIYPGGHGIGNIYFSDWLLAFFIWIIGLGSPTQHLVDVAGVYFPVILAALTVIPVYFIGKTLFNRWAGVLAALLIAIFPGEYLGRSLLGFNDTPAVEVLFSTTALAFFILAVKEARQRKLTFRHIIQRDWATFRRPLIYGLLAGLFSGFYLISWVGALLFIFIVTLYIIIQFIIDHLKKQSVEYLGIVSIITFLVALIIFAPFPANILFIVAVVFALLIPAVLSGISWVLVRRRVKPFYYPVCIVGTGVVVLVIFYAINPGLFDSMIALFSIFNPAGAMGTTTLEMQPFLSPQGSFSTGVAWSGFTTSFFLLPGVVIPGFAFISLAILIYLHTRQDTEDRRFIYHLVWVVAILVIIVALMLLMNSRSVRYLTLLPLAIIIGLFFWRSRDDKTILLFFVWTLIILMATLAQRRFAYYLVVNMALLSAYISWEIIWWGGIRKLVISHKERQEQEQPPPEPSRQPDYYGILGISRYASRKQIQSTFRNIAAKYHRVETHTPEEEDSFKEINRAYEVLVNPERRASYDRVLSGRLEKKRYRESPGKSRSANTHYVTSALAIVVVLFLVFFPNVSKSKDVAAVARFAPSDAWMSALTWLKDNTPEPMDDPDAYYQPYEPPADGTYDYPESAYGVTSWWDYGYWIARIAHRLPSANPGQDPTRIKNVADLFLAEDEAAIRELMATMDSSYVISDYDTAKMHLYFNTATGQIMTEGKFWAVITWAGRSTHYYADVFLVPYEDDKLGPKLLYYPEYYSSMLVRLYNFDGKAVTDATPIVVEYDERVDKDGNSVKIVTDAKNFPNYQEAVDYVEGKETGNCRIVGLDPLVSPIPLEAMNDFELVYAADTDTTEQGETLIPGAKIFKYTGQ